MAEVAFAKFLHSEIPLFSSLPVLYSSEEGYYGSPHLRSGDLCTTSSKAEYVYT